MINKFLIIYTFYLQWKTLQLKKKLLSNDFFNFYYVWFYPNSHRNSKSESKSGLIFECLYLNIQVHNTQIFYYNVIKLYI